MHSHADEAEALLGKRRDNEHEVSIQIKTEFMQLWDGLTTDCHAGVLVLAATNRPGELDEAVLRRFSHQYEVQMRTGCIECRRLPKPGYTLGAHHGLGTRIIPSCQWSGSWFRWERTVRIPVLIRSLVSSSASQADKFRSRRMAVSSGPEM